MLGQAVRPLFEYTARGHSQLRRLIPLTIRAGSNVRLPLKLKPLPVLADRGFLLNQKTATSATVPIETQSPVPVSRKWEYSGVRPETFGVFALKG
jgi:hypothetical protein